MKPLISHLTAGGLITNYYCTSQCAHCLYACGPFWQKEYISREVAKKILLRIRNLGCYSLHIGGGEPLLDINGLTTVLDCFNELKMQVEYVETNSSWYKDEQSAENLLKRLKSCGLNTLLVSISPFHNEHIPFYKVKGVLKACKKAGMNVFPWIMDFYAEINAFTDAFKHSIDEYENRFGPGYLEHIPQRYWVEPRGRALVTYKPYMKSQDLKEILSNNPDACRELFNVSHFHVDLFNNYIPGLCSGLAIKSEDLGFLIKQNDYPVLFTLMHGGIRALLQLAEKDFGFKTRDKYVSKCDLCYEIRRYLCLEKNINTKDLAPRRFYEHLKRI